MPFNTNKTIGKIDSWILPPEEEGEHECYMCGAPMEKPGHYGCSTECKRAIDED